MDFFTRVPISQTNNFNYSLRSLVYLQIFISDGSLQFLNRSSTKETEERMPKRLRILGYVRQKKAKKKDQEKDGWTVSKKRLQKTLCSQVETSDAGQKKMEALLRIMMTSNQSTPHRWTPHVYQFRRCIIWVQYTFEKVIYCAYKHRCPSVDFTAT